MKESIYTIPVNEAFDKKCSCPICTLFDDIEEKEIDKILGAAMMEPDIRIKTNKEGFCSTHFEMMFKGKNRLSLALMLESHLDEVNKRVFKNAKGLTGKVDGKKQISILNNENKSCYVCSRINNYMVKFAETVAFMFRSDIKFRDKVREQKYFCFNHYEMLLNAGKDTLNKKDFEDFSNILYTVQSNYFTELKEDISWFCKKFDYRYENEPWKNSKDAVPRAICALTGDNEKL